MFKQFTQLSNLAQDLKNEFQMGNYQAAAVAVGLYFYSISFTIAFASVLGFIIPPLPAFETTAIVNWLVRWIVSLVVLYVAIRAGVAVGKAFCTNQVLVFSMVMSLLSGEVVQELASKASVVFAVFVGVVLTGVGSVMSFYAMIVFRFALGLGLPTDQMFQDLVVWGMVILSILVNFLTLIIPGLTSDTMDPETIKRYALYKVAIASVKKAQEEIKQTPGLGLQIVLGLIGLPEGYKPADARFIDSLPSMQRPMLTRTLREHPGAQVYVPAEGQGKIIIVDPRVVSDNPPATTEQK